MPRKIMIFGRRAGVLEFRPDKRPFDQQELLRTWYGHLVHDVFDAEIYCAGIGRRPPGHRFDLVIIDRDPHASDKAAEWVERWIREEMPTMIVPWSNQMPRIIVTDELP